MFGFVSFLYRRDRDARSTRPGGRRALGEEKEVGLDAGVGTEDAVGQADDGVQVALGEQGSLMRVFTPSPKRVPSGRTSRRGRLVLRSFMMSTRNRSAVSRVRNRGKLDSMPSSSMPPNGGLVTMTSTRSLGDQSRRGRARVLSCRTLDGTSMPCSIRLVMQSTWGRCFFSTPAIQPWMKRSSCFGLGLFTKMLNGADQETRPCRRPGQEWFPLAQTRVDLLNHELSDGARSIELAGITALTGGL